MNTINEVKARMSDPSLLVESCKVGNRWISASKDHGMPVENPATGEIITSVPVLDASHASEAISAASEAFLSWRKVPAKQRSEILMRWYQLMIDNVDDLAIILTAEQGKPISEAKAEIKFTASFFEWYAAEGRRAYGSVVPSPDIDKRFFVLRQPVGVTAVVTPWNFPAGMIGRKVAPALAAGCTVVIKPASQTPLTAMALVNLAEKAGVPDGVVNILTGRASEIGGVLLASPSVAKLTFTGSTGVGKHLNQQAAHTLKHVSLELGGNAPFIVFADADVDAAVKGAIQAKFRNAGQTCVCANRIIVEEPIYEEFVSRFAMAVSQLKVGSGFEDGVEIGPLIDQRAVNSVSAMLDDAVSRGGTVVTPGYQVPNLGSFFSPVVIKNVPLDSRVCTEEIFGPIAPVIKFNGEAEAIDIANMGDEGLAAYFYTNDVSRVWRVAEAIDCGLIGVNTGLMTTAETPFGGMKSSGLGREGGKEGLDAFLETKSVCIGSIE
jgi:succinate-semialdehyde dehydrogenase/glutarate-semialdehyde dehydrogenase